MYFWERIEKISVKKIVVVNTLIILIYMFISNAISASAGKEQNKRLVDLQKMQREELAMIKDIQENMVPVSVNEAEFDLVWEDISDMKEITNDIKLFELQVELSSIDAIEDREKWFLEYKDICERYAEYVGPPVTIYDVYSSDEIYLLQRMIQTEIGSGEFESKVHVADVVWNRMEDSDWPDTITGIITAPNQFAYGATNINESTKLAVEYSFMFPDETNGALAFQSAGYSPYFGSYTYIFTDSNNHNFYGKVMKEQTIDDGLLLRFNSNAEGDEEE